MSDNKRTRKLTCRMLCERYGIVPMTIKRWMAAKILPQPMVINKIRYWDESEIEASEREHTPTARQMLDQQVRP